MACGRLILGAAVLCGSAALAAGCGGTSGLGSGAAAIVPASAPAYIVVDTDPGSSQWKTVERLADRFPDKQKGIDFIERDLRKEERLDYDRDVKPALGPELDLVWIDFDHDGQDIVGLMQPNDEDAFKRIIAKNNAKDPTD